MAKLAASGLGPLCREKTCFKSPEHSLTWLPVDLYLEEALGPVLHPHGRPSASPPGHTKHRRSPRGPSLPPSLPPHPGVQLQRGGSASAPTPAAGEKLALRGSGSCRQHASRSSVPSARPIPSFQPLPHPSPYGSFPPGCFYLAAPALCPLTASSPQPPLPPRPAARRRRRPRPPLPARPQWPRQAPPPLPALPAALFPALCVRGRRGGGAVRGRVIDLPPCRV